MVEISSGRIRLRCDAREGCDAIFTPHTQRLVEGQHELLRDMAWLQGWRTQGGLIVGSGKPATEDLCQRHRPPR
jgi:hypothetical protein